ncbi:hypothetical protein D3C85_1443690 [compost metagenome]
MWQLAVGKHITLNETPRTPPYGTAIHMLGGDAMVHHQATLSHRTEQALAVQRQIGMADVLEHTDADHLVEAAILRQITIVEDL